MNFKYKRYRHYIQVYAKNEIECALPISFKYYEN
jgi:hypothetical protein